MKRRFSVSVWREGEWCVAQCLDVDVASQGKTEAEALGNLREALELYLQPPYPSELPRLATVEVDVRAAWAASFVRETSSICANSNQIEEQPVVESRGLFSI